MPTSTLIKSLDAVFSQYIRLVETDEAGYGYDFVTGERLTYSTAEASHFIKRSHLATRWEPLNVHAQLPQNNQENERNTIAKENYLNQIKRFFGQDVLIRLDDLKKTDWKPWDFELRELLAKYRQVNRELAKDKMFEVRLQ